MKCYVHNIFTTLSQQILNSKLLLVIMGGKKSNLNCEFKLEPITTFHIWFFFWRKMPYMICYKNILDVAPLILTIPLIVLKIILIKLCFKLTDI